MSGARTVLVSFAVLAIAVAATSVLVRPRHEATPRPVTATTSAPRPLFVAFSGPDRVYTTEHDRGSGPLEATSGTLLVRAGRAWSGRPDLGPPDPERGTTHSAVLRARTVRRDFRDQRVRLRLRSEGPTVPKGGAPHDYDGVSIGVRSVSAAELYYVNVQRRDGLVAIKRKDPAGGGRYVTLARTKHPPTYGRWVDVEVVAQDVVDGVRVALSIDGRPAVEVVDRAAGDQQPLRRAGRVLLRADNCEVSFDDLEVKPLAAG
jgi:hypothetical protein